MHFWKYHLSKFSKVQVKKIQENIYIFKKTENVGLIPAVCPSFKGLTLVIAPHLARSYHHLFPLDAFQEISNENSETSSVNVHE